MRKPTTWGARARTRLQKGLKLGQQAGVQRHGHIRKGSGVHSAPGSHTPGGTPRRRTTGGATRRQTSHRAPRRQTPGGTSHRRIPG